MKSWGQNSNGFQGLRQRPEKVKTNGLLLQEYDPSLMAWAGPSGSTLQCPIYGFVSKHDKYVLRNMDRIQSWLEFHFTNVQHY